MVRNMAPVLGPPLDSTLSRVCVMLHATLDLYRLSLLRKEVPVRSHLIAKPDGGGSVDWWWWWQQVLVGSA